MDTKHLIDAIVRPTTVLIAQISTAAGIRSPLPRVRSDLEPGTTDVLLAAPSLGSATIAVQGDSVYVAGSGPWGGRDVGRILRLPK